MAKLAGSYKDLYKTYKDMFDIGYEGTELFSGAWRISRKEKAQAIEWILENGRVPNDEERASLDIFDNNNSVDNKAFAWMERFLETNQQKIIDYKTEQETITDTSIYDDTEDEDVLTSDEQVAEDTEGIGDLTEDDYSRVDNIFTMSEDSLVNEIMGLENQAALGSLALEETQEKFGISGGMAMAQYNQMQMGLAAQSKDVYGQLNNLGIEKELFIDELKTQKTEEDRASLLFGLQYKTLFEQGKQAEYQTEILENTANTSSDYSLLGLDD